MPDPTRRRFCEQYKEAILNTYILLYVVAGFIGITMNSIVIFFITRTRQARRNQSIKLLLYLSMVDIFTSLVSFLRITTLDPGSAENCNLGAIYYTIQLLSFYMSIYLYALTGFDRFLRIKYLEEYSNVFSKKRFYTVLSTYLFICLFQFIITGFLDSQAYIGYTFQFTFPINVIVMILIIVFYVLSMIYLRRYQRTNQNISEATKSVMKITVVYLYLFIFNIGTIVIVQIFLGSFKLSKSEVIGLRNLTGVLPPVIGTLNAIAFLIVNPPTRNLISRFCLSHRRCGCSANPQVNPDVELNVIRQEIP